MRELIDCHVHTERCGHACGTVDDYVSAAVRAGLSTIAMTEHLALPERFDPTRHLSMPAEDLEPYLVEVDFARGRYPDLDVVTGLEADFLAGREAETRAALDAARAHPDGPTFVLGSVHFIAEWAFDDPHDVAAWERHDVDQVWRDYFELWNRAASAGLFDVMAHPDLVKKFGHFPSFDPAALYGEAAATAAAAGVGVEVSTAGLRKPVGELYPGAAFLSAFCEAGVPVTVGSDAHDPIEVGYCISEAYDAIQAAGYATVRAPLPGGGWREIAL